MNAIEICVGRASIEQVVEHLNLCDALFVPPLSTKVNITDYAKKLTDLALCLEAWYQGALVGLLCVYCNEPRNGAFVTNVSIVPEFQGRGMASELVRNAIETVKEIGVDSLRLEVDDTNVIAMRLYRQFGFTPERVTSQSTMMILNL
ncbi:GNAT family N-acetyltransferase [Buttiauxella sp. B2]|uniref:GNAT family N-acetyltransferase n=1 Tax=Buttiauxella sp. B2 TaxID=2587812 RepID=UPI001124967D|nr:GNAT family N-acetyltransferase [Buttiauxella sp. B2]TNV22986.1 GNAT family N-acetyltransferase [Buttiauxella sp. B2]